MANNSSSADRSRRTMDAARSISSSVRQSRGWGTREACHVPAPPSSAPTVRRIAAIAVEVVCAFVMVVTVLATAAGPARAVDAQTDEGDDEVTCPATLDGVPLSLDEEFAGTPRALANDEGVLVRYSLLCPYVRGNGTEVAELTLAWSRYAADDLDCSTVELDSEPAGDGRVRGLVDHPSLSAQVTFDADEAVLPAVEEAATALLTEVPTDAQPCVGGADPGVDASVAPSRDEGSTGVPLALALALLALTGCLVLVAAALVRRSRSRARRRAAQAVEADHDATRPGEPSVGELAAALRAKRSGTALAASGPAELRRPSAADPRTEERRSLELALRRAQAERDAVEQLLVEARADLAVHREHAEAVRRLAASARGETDHREFLSSYAGVMTLAVAATNLVSTSARRAAALAGDRGTGGHMDLAVPAGELQALHARVIAAAERGLGDSRYWLWQDRRLAVLESLAELGDAVPRLVEVQRRLAEHVRRLAAHHRRLHAEVAELDAARAELDRRNGQEDGAPRERAGV